MPRRTTTSVSFYSQAKFLIEHSKLERELNFGESGLCYSNKFGLVFISLGLELFVVRHSDLESCFDGGDDEQPLDKSKILATHKFESHILMIKLSGDDMHLSVITTEFIDIFHVVNISKSVSLYFEQDKATVSLYH
jgi:hypothetical protein